MLKNKLLAATGNSDEPLYSDSVFSTYLYTGNGSTQTINNGIDLAGKGGLVWIKQRSPSTSDEHALFDTARGSANRLCTNNIDAQVNYGSSDGFGDFSSLGFTLTTDSGYYVNHSGRNYTSWTFRKAPKFFTHTTISHTNGTATNIALADLGTVGQVVAKITNTTGDWIVWHRSLTAGNNLRLNTTAAQTTTNAWLSVSGTTATLSASAPTGTYVIYAWAHDTAADGIIQCGSFTTDGAGNATVTLGWEPQYVMFKFAAQGSSGVASGGWAISDSMRGLTVNGSNALLFANSTVAEISDGESRPTSTGFTQNFNNASIGGVTFIYLAIRRPNKPPTSGTEVYNAIARGSASTGTSTGIGFPPDMSIGGNISSSNWNHPVIDRLRGVQTSNASPNSVLYTNLTNAESASVLPHTYWANQTAYWGDGSGTGAYSYFFRRAPGFFDVVCYTGTGVARTVNHSLGVAPELMIVKQRSPNARDWGVYVSTLGAGDKLRLNQAAPAGGPGTDTSYWNNVLPTASAFTVGSQADTNQSTCSFVAYLFASLPGIGKVGSYTGNGTSQTINCGFSTGARFVLIKRTDSTGDWYVWDSARGIVAANDPHLSLNTTAAEVTTNDSVDPDASGFIVNQNTATNINVSGGSYIYLAIA